MSDVLQDKSDEELMLAYQDDDQNAFDLLLARHKKPVYNYILRFLRNEEAAEEGLQEVFLKVVRSRKRYQQKAKFTTWLYTMARNYCIDHSRKKKFRNHLSLDQGYTHDDSSNQSQAFEKYLATNQNSDDLASANELHGILEKILDELVPEQKEVFLLREFQGLPFDQIAKMTGASTNTVKSRMRYALKAIQKRLQEYGIFSVF